MEYPDIYQFGGGFHPSANISGFPLLIGPPSVMALTTNQYAEYGDALGNMGGSHDLVYRITAAQAAAAGGAFPGDLLNGANIVVKQDADGVDMLGYDDPSLVTVEGAWIKANGNGDYADVDPYSRSAPNVAVTGGSGLLSTQPTANCLLFLSVYLPQNESWANAKYVGFDCGGYRDPTDFGAAGALMMTLGDLGGGYQSGAVHSIDPWDGAGAAYADINTALPNNYGHVTIVTAVNGTSATVSARKVAGSAITNASGALLGNATLGTAWTAPPTGLGGHNVNLGEGCLQAFGVYAMGIRNYSAAISLVEVERVCTFMNKTGKLPYWWL